jgi:hypothetical protein
VFADVGHGTFLLPSGTRLHLSFTVDHPLLS